MSMRRRPDQRPLVPIALRIGSRCGLQKAAIERRIGMAVGIGEEAAELLIGGQMPRRRELELVERDMRRIEVDGVMLCGDAVM